MASRAGQRRRCSCCCTPPLGATWWRCRTSSYENRRQWQQGGGGVRDGRSTTWDRTLHVRGRGRVSRPTEPKPQLVDPVLSLRGAGEPSLTAPQVEPVPYPCVDACSPPSSMLGDGFRIFSCCVCLFTLDAAHTSIMEAFKEFHSTSPCAQLAPGLETLFHVFPVSGNHLVCVCRLRGFWM